MDNVNPSDVVKIVKKYTSYINAVCRRYYIVGGTSEDLFQEGVIGILQACKNYNGDNLFEDRFDPFVKMCIKRQIIDALKKANTQKNKALNEAVSIINVDGNGEEKSVLDSMLDRSGKISNDPLDLFINREKYEEGIAKCNERLSEFEKLVLDRYLLGEKQSEIAKVLGRDVKSIDNTIQRIKSKVK